MAQKYLEQRLTKNAWYEEIPSSVASLAFYMPNKNLAGIGLGVAVAPLFDAKYPSYINYGALGQIIGHEITHGFDNKGRRYNSQGVLLMNL